MVVLRRVRCDARSGVRSPRRYHRHAGQSEARLKEAQRIATWVVELRVRHRAARLVARGRRILGLSAEAPMSFETVLEAIHPEDREEAVSAFNLLVKMAQPLALEQLRIVRPDWSVRHLEVSTEIERASDGTPLRADGIFHDITERWSAEEKHRQLARNSPARRGGSGVEEIAARLIREDARRWRRLSAGRARSATAALASPCWARRGRGSTRSSNSNTANEALSRVHGMVEGEAAKRPVDINAIIRDAVDLVRHEAAARHRGRFRFGKNLPRVNADPAQIAQVIISLARNGVAAWPVSRCRAGGSRSARPIARQRLVPGGGLWRGDRLPAEVRDRLFYPYVSTKPGELGSGCWFASASSSSRRGVQHRATRSVAASCLLHAADMSTIREAPPPDRKRVFDGGPLVSAARWRSVGSALSGRWRSSARRPHRHPAFEQRHGVVQAAAVGDDRTRR